MKKIFLALVAAFAISTSAFAQFNGGQQFSPDQIAQMQTDRMASQLGLDDAQKEAVLKLTKENFSKMRPGMGGPRQQGQPSEEQMKEMRKQMEESQAAYKAELKKILTEEQFVKYEEMEKQQREMFRRGGNGGPRGMRGQGGPRQ